MDIAGNGPMDVAGNGPMDVAGFGPQNHIHKESALHFNIDYKCETCIKTLYEDVLKLKMNFECFRKDTFKGWPKTFIHAGLLAKEGFYYLQNKDCVKCNFCDIVLSDWKEDDMIRDEHAKYSAGCKMLWRAATANVPIHKPIPTNISRGAFIKMGKDALLSLLDGSSCLVIYK